MSSPEIILNVIYPVKPWYMVTRTTLTDRPFSKVTTFAPLLSVEVFDNAGERSAGMVTGTLLKNIRAEETTFVIIHTYTVSAVHGVMVVFQ